MVERRETIIIGGGASGLAAARRLRQLGHDDVVVLESGEVAGGKCITLQRQGRTYELGATFATPSYRHVRRITREHGVAWKAHLGARFLRPGSTRFARGAYVPPSMGLGDLLRFPDRVAKLAAEGLGPHLLRFPRLDGVSEQWHDTFEQWAEAHDMRPILEMVRPWATAFGYGFMDEVPAAYMLNYMLMLGPAFELPSSGFGGLWQRVASTLDVRLGAHVSSVQRGPHGVSVQTSEGTFEGSTLVIACPLDNALEFLDASDEERDLFERVLFTDFQVVAFDTEGMPRSGCTFVPENFTREQCGKPMFCYRRYADTGVVNLYSYRSEGGLDDAEAQARAFVQRVGGTVREVLARRLFRYFPHVGSDSLQQGFYPRLEALQGTRQTFYAGEVMSFSCVEPVVAYAEQLAGRIAGIDIRPEQLPRPGVANDVIRRLVKRSA